MNQLIFILHQIGICLMIQHAYFEGFESGVAVGEDWTTRVVDPHPDFEGFKEEATIYL